MAGARVSELVERINTMVMNPQPLGLGFQPQMANYTHEVVGPPLGYYETYQKYGYCTPLEATMRVPNTHMCHPGPFGTPQEWTHYNKESTEMRRRNDMVNSFKARGQGARGYKRGGGGSGGGGGQQFILDSLFERKGSSGRGGSYSNTLEKHNNLFY